ncbi:MAG: hypothetical protein A3F09_01975 [Chlamydiae bacterium RIFCSPHIGHO2_12_FULL_49_11]|nr:MAG: hypothetical protein A3F09_01975 [Chlamydiae bacterium RIFCSPHIGHO2_12_FULL_49_11]
MQRLIKIVEKEIAILREMLSLLHSRERGNKELTQEHLKLKKRLSQIREEKEGLLEELIPEESIEISLQNSQISELESAIERCKTFEPFPLPKPEPEGNRSKKTLVDENEAA